MSTAATCYQHPDRLAVEHCETCQRPVCAACLWYAESGERLCPEHAAAALQAGRHVTPPEHYAEGIPHSQASAARLPQAEAPYKGNSTDLTALAALMAGLASALACFGLTYVLPLIAFILGLVAWLQARDALNPQRARRMSLVGLAGGGVFLLAVLGGLALMVLCFVLQFAVIMSANRGPVFPTPTPFPPITP
ncbi:MAG: hypothetical protein JNK29_20010 [Anaerolineales bacterium]|nr:hypothetical protein [Anaerolineales bacterium]